MAPSHPPACKSHKYTILISHFLSITQPLAEFFLHGDARDCRSLEPLKQHPTFLVFVIKCVRKVFKLCAFNTIDLCALGTVDLSDKVPKVQKVGN